MRLGALVAWSVLFATAQAAPAQVPLTDQQKLGERLFEQSCGVCHTKPTLVSGRYAPALSKETGGGREDVVRDFIANGSQRMPGFKYTYDATQIAAIAAYLKVMPEPPPDAAPARQGGAPARADN
ncbi:MAG: cytochrome c [Alphaproteobacteria bacterium]|nr:cytochrome c [Alphaproteobacteria bacterium]